MRFQIPSGAGIGNARSRVCTILSHRSEDSLDFLKSGRMNLQQTARRFDDIPHIPCACLILRSGEFQQTHGNRRVEIVLSLTAPLLIKNLRTLALQERNDHTAPEQLVGHLIERLVALVQIVEEEHHGSVFFLHLLLCLILEITQDILGVV